MVPVAVVVAPAVAVTVTVAPLSCVVAPEGDTLPALRGLALVVSVYDAGCTVNVTGFTPAPTVWKSNHSSPTRPRATMVAGPGVRTYPVAS